MTTGGVDGGEGLTAGRGDSTGGGGGLLVADAGGAGAEVAVEPGLEVLFGAPPSAAASGSIDATAKPRVRPRSACASEGLK